MERLEKLAEKLDKVKDDVTEVKVDVAEMKTLIKVTHANVEEHIAGDNKIITKLEPILDQLGEMVQDHMFEKMAKEKRSERNKSTALKLGIVGSVVGIAIGITRLLGLF